MAENVTWDDSSLMSGLDRLSAAIDQASHLAIYQIGTELLRLSDKEVPHNIGMLQASASTEPVSDQEILVGYNKVYAAYQHEGNWPDGSHQIKHYQKGRKGHYLSDPLMMNLSVFEGYLQAEIEAILR